MFLLIPGELLLNCLSFHLCQVLHHVCLRYANQISTMVVRKLLCVEGQRLCMNVSMNVRVSMSVSISLCVSMVASVRKRVSVSMRK